MAEIPKTKSPWIIYSFFILGLLCTISFRILTILSELSPSFVRPVWYFGVIGYIFFFLYRFKISNKRRLAVKDYNLIEAVKEAKCMTDDQRAVLLYLLNSIVKSKENFNYFAIFILSAIALIIDIILCLNGN